MPWKARKHFIENIQTNLRLIFMEFVTRRGGDVMNDIPNIISNIITNIITDGIYP